MNTYVVYIGSNNETKQLEMETIEKETGKLFDGFSLSQVVGYWKGSKENTAQVTIVTEFEEKIMELAKELKLTLHQEAVLVSKIGNSLFI